MLTFRVEDSAMSQLGTAKQPGGASGLETCRTEARRNVLLFAIQFQISTSDTFGLATARYEVLSRLLCALGVVLVMWIAFPDGDGSMGLHEDGGGAVAELGVLAVVVGHDGSVRGVACGVIVVKKVVYFYGFAQVVEIAE